jgi:superfamily II RNA helicase
VVELGFGSAATTTKSAPSHTRAVDGHDLEDAVELRNHEIRLAEFVRSHPLHLDPLQQQMNVKSLLKDSVVRVA